MFKVGDCVALKSNQLHNVWPKEFPKAGEKCFVVCCDRSSVLVRHGTHGFILNEKSFVKVAP